MKRIRYIVEVDRVTVVASGVERLDRSELRANLLRALQREMLDRGLPVGAAVRPSIQVGVAGLHGGTASLAGVIASTIAGATTGGASNG